MENNIGNVTVILLVLYR